jgi:diadenosine tetraphosphate (Ap4A) HIT family hydrolase
MQTLDYTTIMDLFKLDERLERDCHVLGLMQDSTLLLLDNQLVPWFILVPHVELTEFTDLSFELQQKYLFQVNQLAEFAKHHYQFTKLNFATIGNVVEQLHLHLIVRSTDDYCWPDVVWGNKYKESYNIPQVDAIKNCLKDHLNEQFTPLL